MTLKLAPGVYDLSRTKDLRVGDRGTWAMCDRRRDLTLQAGKVTTVASIRKTGQPVSGEVVGLKEPGVPGAFIHVKSAEATGDPYSRDEWKLRTFDAVTCDVDGAFKTARIPPGRYKLIAEAYKPTAWRGGRMLPDFIGTAEVTVPKDGPPPHVRIEMKPRPERPRAEADEPHWLVGTWIQQRTDKPGRDEPSYYIMRLNADGSWVNASLWGTPEKPVKVTVTNRGRKWTVIQRRAIWSDWRLEAQEPGPGRAYSLRLWLDDGSRVGLREMVRKDADTILFYAFDSILMKSEYRRVDPKTKAVLEGFLRDANPATPPGGPVSNPVEIEILPGKE